MEQMTEKGVWLSEIYYLVAISWNSAEEIWKTKGPRNI